MLVTPSSNTPRGAPALRLESTWSKHFHLPRTLDSSCATAINPYWSTAAPIDALDPDLTASAQTCLQIQLFVHA